MQIFVATLNASVKFHIKNITQKLFLSKNMISQRKTATTLHSHRRDNKDLKFKERGVTWFKV